MTDWVKARTVIEGGSVSDAIDEYSSKFTRFEDLWNSLKWYLAGNNNTSDYMQREKNGRIFWLYKTDKMKAGCDIPVFTVVFEINDNEIIIYGVKAEDE